MTKTSKILNFPLKKKSETFPEVIPVAYIGNTRKHTPDRFLLGQIEEDRFFEGVCLVGWIFVTDSILPMGWFIKNEFQTPPFGKHMFLWPWKSIIAGHETSGRNETMHQLPSGFFSFGLFESEVGWGKLMLIGS